MSAVPSDDSTSLPGVAKIRTKADRQSFHTLVAEHRAALLAHCYRFTGSVHDAEDLVQETFLRAWRAIDRFEGRSSQRNWLYRIATNVCLNANERKATARRLLPDDVGGPTAEMPKGRPAVDAPWIEPLPDSMIENAADTSPGPAARYELRETIRLAFVSATQRLPARQRAVLLLRDVLGWSATETADALGMSVASVTSALQRARGTLNKGVSPEEIRRSVSEKSERSIAKEYADAWERADIDGFVSLLAKDASMVMPPWNEWYSGRSAIRWFFGRAFAEGWSALERDAFRMVATRANGEHALATYLRRSGRDSYHAHALQVLTIRRRKVRRLTIFVGPRYFKKFGLAPELGRTG